MGSIYDIQVERIDGTSASMSEYRDEALLMARIQREAGMHPNLLFLRFCLFLPLRLCGLCGLLLLRVPLCCSGCRGTPVASASTAAHSS